ncbi:MAG TPA: phosphoglycerate dehydrogenase family protein, partial [Cryomorphaceae bacterium]|nr:phosphoglycerate dehydrogenase family protein [Cryomorphaceae bacterium]
MAKIAITDYFDTPSAEEREILGDLVSVGPGPDTEVLLVWHDKIDASYVKDLPKLRGVQRYGVGFDNLDVDYLKSKGITCCNNPDYGVDEVSDTAMAFIMTISRGVFRYDAIARKLTDTWQENILPQIKRANQTKVGVIGAGRIGTSVLLKCQALGFQTVFFDPYKESGHEKVVRAKRVHSLDELLAEADIVSIHCPLSKATSGMVNQDFISAMKDGAALVNTARGGLVADLEVLHDNLKSGKLSFVYLDVIPQEPPADNMLIEAWRAQPDWLQGRLIINPHTSYF